MAGKADLVNGIVDPFEAAGRLPTYDGWGTAAADDDGDPSSPPEEAGGAE